MTYRTVLSVHALRQYQKLDPSVRSQIQSGIDALGESPSHGPKVKRLKGRLREYCRYRVGDYRVLYTADTVKHIVYVDYIQHRKEVYRGR